MAVDYNFYLAPYGGRAIDQNDWDRLEKRAAHQLTRYKRIYTVTAPNEDAESMAICAMAEAIQSFEIIQNGEGGPIQGAKIGSVSVTYGSTYLKFVVPLAVLPIDTGRCDVLFDAEVFRETKEVFFGHIRAANFY